MDDDRDRSSCSKCGSAVRNTGERDGLIFYICDTCGLRGAYSVPPRGRARWVNPAVGDEPCIVKTSRERLE